MENQTRYLTFLICLIFALRNLISCVEVSSYITFDSQEDSTKQPTVINNIRIIVDKNGTQESGVDACKNGVCSVSVSSKRDEDGNIVTDVHLNLLTKLRALIDATDIPIVNGTRGLEDAYKNLFDVRRLNRSQPSLYLRENIPQVKRICTIKR